MAAKSMQFVLAAQSNFNWIN